MTPRYATVLFDLDHTLLDSDESARIAFVTTMESIGVEPTAEVFATYDRLNQALWRQVEAGLISPNEVKVRRFEQLLAALEVDGDPTEMGSMFVQSLTDHGELFPDALGLLDSLDGHVRMGMVTNGIGAVQRGRVERLGIAERFEVLSISGELGVSKPDASIFDLTLEWLGIDDRSSVVMIGDSLASDIAGGSNAGLDTIWFNPNGETSNGVRATFEVERLADVVEVIAG